MKTKLIITRNRIKVLICAFIFFSLSFNAVSSTLNGKITKIIDGDTVYFEENNEKKFIKLRLVGIDAPEIKQNFGMQSKYCLSDLVMNKSVQIMLYGQDRYKRYLAKILVDGIDINLTMLKQGCAWFYKKYRQTLDENDQLTYNQAEILARQTKIGLFKNDKAQPPWGWRKKN